MNDFTCGVCIGGAIIGLIVFMVMTETLRQSVQALEDQEKRAAAIDAERHFWMSKYFGAAFPVPAVTPEPPVTAEAPAAERPTPEMCAATLPARGFVFQNPGWRTTRSA